MTPAQRSDKTFTKVLGDAFRRASSPLLQDFLRRSLPTLEGVVKLSGLEGSVEVLRDRFGVPQVFAESEWDLFFAQGYVHAQDRFFQMELGRRAGHGRLSELLGENALELDRLSRTVGFGRIACASVEDGESEALGTLEAYSAGVNACLATEPRPPELRFLRHRPEPWTPADSGLVRGHSLEPFGKLGVEALTRARRGAAWGPRRSPGLPGPRRRLQRLGRLTPTQRLGLGLARWGSAPRPGDTVSLVRGRALRRSHPRSRGLPAGFARGGDRA